MTQQTIAADQETKTALKEAQDKLSEELGVRVSQKDTVRKLSERYVNTGEVA